MANDKTTKPAGGVERPSRDISRAMQLLERRRNRGKGLQADWANAEATDLAAAICAVTASGCAITFGYTRDGGACTITILAEGETDTEYIRPTEDMALSLAAITQDFSKL